MATQLTHTATAFTRSAVHGRRAVGVAAAVGAALAGWAIAEGVFGVDVHAPGFGGEPPTDVGAGDVALSAAVAGLAGWALLALLERITDRAARLWSAPSALWSCRWAPRSVQGSTSPAASFWSVSTCWWQPC